MLHIDTLTLGAYQVNCYIVRREDSDRCVVIDPGYEPGRILAYLQKNNLQLEAILLTHGHFDHVGGVRELAADTDGRKKGHDENYDTHTTKPVGKTAPIK